MSLPLATTEPHAVSGLPLPAQVGKYPVLRRLGEGATSEVFLARDEFHQRDVAIKRVRLGAVNDPNDGRFFERFFAAEAALVGRLQHPNVVQIFDAVADSNEPYLVMEYVSGHTLRQYCRADQLLPLELIVEIGFKCAMALGYVFRQGLVHRDVKPANILAVITNGSITDVKVTDFGSVLNMSAETTQVYRVGSLAYMAPEQLDGASLDSRADMYSLGAVLYHLIAGRPPFDAPSQSAMMNQVYNAMPLPPSQLRSGVGEGVDAVILRALAKRPDDRFASWDEFAQALSGLIVNHQVPRGQLQGVLDSERFNLLRTLDFFSNFGDVELWEVVHRAKWQRYTFGHALYRRGEETRNFHIIAQGEVEVFREGTKVAQLGAGTSVGEMVYLAPSAELRRHSTDVIVTESATTITFTPDTLAQVSPGCRHLFDEAFIRVLVRRLHAAHEALAHPRRIM
ncbi:MULTISPECIES: serine/threonine-protein kinase [unclassified Rhizobacter]|uniref:serine/threonine-protein kinase n=1 Tax=unclassified Rhizobacter TaxID=2640088 RepID=UPI0006F263BB|nr:MULTISPECIES: serine/threonine-protein kinase [unclassified Rhizobacter]KQU76821.1 serine/threonine protein kinase [Rhizobacter sp. Root29]KQV97341.1 serine/threonine protein kinase [Rhizobacter sp. Root1238]KRB10013.1 serine/threonine protein kinase [Rhizobacter sp. Root16D2]